MLSDIKTHRKSSTFHAFSNFETKINVSTRLKIFRSVRPHGNSHPARTGGGQKLRRSRHILPPSSRTAETRIGFHLLHCTHSIFRQSGGSKQRLSGRCEFRWLWRSFCLSKAKPIPHTQSIKKTSYNKNITTAGTFSCDCPTLGWVCVTMA